MRKCIALLFLAVAAAIPLHAQVANSSIEGLVVDASTDQPEPLVTVAIWQAGQLVGGTSTDFDGKFEIKPVKPGVYDLRVTSVGFDTISITGINVRPGAIVSIPKERTRLTKGIVLGGITIYPWADELFRKEPDTKISLGEEELRHMPTPNLTDQILNSTGYGKDDGSGNMYFNGMRDDASLVVVNGVKMPGGVPNLPKGAASDLSLILGGVPVEYGDVTGAVISVTTKAPTHTYRGSVDIMSSGTTMGNLGYVGLDAYGHNQVDFTLSGPLLRYAKRTDPQKKQTLMGFFVAGNLVDRLDPRPSAVGAWKVKDEVLADLKVNPLRQGFTANSVIPNTDYLRLSDFEHVDVRPNTRQRGANLVGSIDVYTTSNTSLSFGGALNASRGNRYDYDHSLLDYENYAQQTSLDWNVFGRFSQSFKKDMTEADKDASSSLIKNASYTLQMDYTRNYFLRQNERFEDDFFQYGYLGKFTTIKTPDFAVGTDSITGIAGSIQQTYRDSLIMFTPSGANPELARFTQRYYELNGWEGFDAEGNAILDPDRIEAFTNYNNIQSGGGLLNGDNLDSRSRSVYGMWVYNGDMTNAHGGQTDNYFESVQNQFRFTGQGVVDIKDHAIKVGFEYEQRVERAYSLNPRSLWTIARLRANSHIGERDLNSPTIEYPGPSITYDRLNTAPGDYTGEDAQAFIDYNMRKVLGLDPDGTDVLDVNAIDPGLYKINYFSADGLYNSGTSLVNYYGYDAYGNRATANPTFDDFFTARDEYGNFTRPIGSFNPIYVAGYIEDSYELDDMILRVGLRVDRYDANQAVLKDKYVLFPTVKAGEDEAYSLLPEGVSDHPGNIGDDYVVYVDNVENPTAIMGYRHGDTWYNAQGAELNDAGALRVSNGLPAPLLVDKENTNSVDVTSASFEDYQPKTNFMPRISFSFPISDDAKFYAHYDVLTKRPTVGNRIDPSDYYFLESRASSAELNNPNLQPERTIDYELGFDQRVSIGSAIRLSAFYRESRNLVQVVRVFDAYPIEYRTYENIDFATVKGMRVEYDFRRMKYLSMRFSYTLQFAEGTGSSATSQLRLARTGEPNLRAPIRLNYDQRHQIVGNFDYRFGDLSADNAPSKALSERAQHLLKNSGVNLVVRGGSGEPYNPQENYSSTALFNDLPSPRQSGKVNGASLPWKFRFDLGVDKSFSYKRDKQVMNPYTHKLESKYFNFNVYVQVQNLLNARNINNVYRATGNPDDDGFLNSANGKSFAEAQNSEASFREYYAIKLQNPTNWELPRRIRLGVRMNF